jgi:hypothetical protein
VKTSLTRSIPLMALAALVTALTGVGSSAAQGPSGFALPPQAAEVAPGVFLLGTGVDRGIPVVGYAYAHHKDGHSSGPGAGGDPAPPPEDESSCYSFIANGARWRTAEDVVVDSANDASLAVSVSDIRSWLQAWETQTSASGIFGAFSGGQDLVADATSTDGRNEVYFDTISEPGVLGYTIVWSSRIGPPSSREIVEADIVIDDSEWDWWTGEGTISGQQLDLGAVFVHEAGHYVGLGHTDQTTLCEQQTMYPSLSYGDDVKQTLGIGDRTGLENLYG